MEHEQIKATVSSSSASVLLQTALKAVFILPFLTTPALAEIYSSTACKADSYQAKQIESEIVVPFRSSPPPGLIAFDAYINGQGPFNLILDSGATINFISERVAQKLRLPTRSLMRPEFIGSNGSSPVQTSQETTVENLEIGNLKLSKTILRVLPSAVMPDSSALSKIDAILGLDFFQNFLIQLDYINLKAYFNNSQKVAPNCENVVFPFVVSSLGMPAIEGKIDGISARFDIDTGSSTSLTLYQPFVERNNLYRRYPNIRKYSTEGLGGTDVLYRVRATALKLGQFEIIKPLIGLISKSSKSTEVTDTAGVIGNDILSRFFVIFDVRHRQIALRKSVRFGEAFHYVAVGMSVDISSGKVTAIERKGLAEHADIRSGDQILNIDGVPYGKLTHKEIVDKLQQLPNNKVHLIVKRRNKLLNIILEFKDVL
ncbi:aspartyl protease family protein [Gloeobacter kilaueensis]|uniref:aspartyl protease family protein n=1 Tax=Gloeobacter kilaueensis TaxID=1416614 RepID=UPI001181FF10|nr:aspartyl protease family protein [Gloeobacter kilaueensis]